MVKMNYVGAAVVLSALTLVSSQSLALPTIDPADIAGTTGIVKSGIENVKNVKGVTGSLGKLNSIVGDAAGTLSRFKEKYGDDIQKAMDMAKKVKQRVGEAAAAYKEVEEERAKLKAEYQNIMDKVGTAQDMIATASDKVSAVSDKASSALGKKNDQQADATNAAQDLQITSQNRHYDDGTVAEEVADAQMALPQEVAEPEEQEPVNSLSLRRGFGRGLQPRATEAEATAAAPAELSDMKVAPAAQKLSVEKAVVTKNPTAATGKLSADKAAAIAKPAAVNNMKKAAETTADAPMAEPAASSAVKKFRTTPLRQKISSYRADDRRLAFALNLGLGGAVGSNDASPSMASGNPTIGEKTVFPFVALCGGDAKEYVDNEEKQKECIDQLVRNNNAKNHVDSLANRRECSAMLYKTMVAMLAEATNSKAKAATYTETLEEQKKDSSQSTQIRDDLAVLGMSTYQTQLLLNEMSLNLSSQILLYTAQQVCQVSDEVLPDEGDATDGEK